MYEHARSFTSVLASNKSGSLRLAGQLMFQPANRSELKLDAIAMGTGPSFWEFIRGPIPWGFRYGCSTIPAYIKLDVYCYGDAVHEPDLPLDRTEIVATPRCWNESMTPFGDLPHGGSGGGMAISTACHRHQIVAIVGFDGFPDDGPDGFYRQWMSDNRELVRYWLRRGKRLLSLMEQSFLNDLLEPV